MTQMKNRWLLFIIQVIMLYGTASGTDVCISGIKISGNKQTKEFTILRELPFSIGDVLAEDKLIEQLRVATNHLNNTSLFNSVYIDYIPDALESDSCLSCIIVISVEERWYYWPQVSLKLGDRNLSNWLHDKNFDRITIGWGLRVYNVFGMRHKFTISDYFGFEKGLRIGYSNIALNKKRTSMLGFSIAGLYNRTINAGAENNRVVYIKSEDSFIDRAYEGLVSYTYRPGIRSVHSFNILFQRTFLGDTVLKYNPDYWGTDKTSNSVGSFTYEYNYEHRDYAAYPTTGHFIGSSFTALTADHFRFFYSRIGLRMQYYTKLMPRWYWSSRLNSSITFKNKRAYLYDQLVGYEEKNITGYDYYVIDGQHNVILNNDLRYCIMPKRTFILGSNSSGSKFKKIHFTLYAKLMFDGGYVYNSYRLPSNTLANSFLWGSGFGFDLVTYYDIVLNCSYAVNKIGESGFYFGVKAPLF
jgi:outer membrane protein assembly factor BamA